VKMDDRSFYMQCGKGEATHTGHPRMAADLTTDRARLVPDQAITDMKEFALARVRVGAASTMTKNKYNTNLTRRQVAYHQEFAKVAQTLEHAQELQSRQGEMSDVDRVLDTIRKLGGSYCALYHRKDASTSELGARRPNKSKRDAKRVDWGTDAGFSLD
jgi:hypothetical protein